MSDEGKVLLGADGNPLVGHDGKIVLADRLWPTTVKLTCTFAKSWGRYFEAAHPYTNDGVWSENWAEDDPGEHPIADRYFLKSNFGIHKQSVVKYSLAWEYTNHSALSIPWARVASDYLAAYAGEIRVQYEDHINPDSISMRCAYSLASQDDPDGAETVWSRSNWAELFSGGDATTASGNMAIPPTPPSELWIAQYADPWTPDPADFGANEVYALIMLGTIDPGVNRRVVALTQNRTITYNLAT